MVIGLATVGLGLPAAFSLKDKRSVLRRLKARVRQTFNVSVAEVDDHDLWGRATLGIAIVSTEAAHARSTLAKCMEAIERERLEIELQDYRIEIL